MRRKDRNAPSASNDPDRLARRLAVKVARGIDSRKAERILVLDLRELTILADFFVLGSAVTQVQIRALADLTKEIAAGVGFKERSVEGYDDSGWILIDYGDVVVHLMTTQSREYYRLERLWGDAPQVDWKPETNETENE